MATPKSKPDSELKIAPNEGLAAYGFGSSDYVVPGYTDEGRLIRGGNPVVGGEQALTKSAMRILRHAMANGGKPQPALTSLPPANPAAPVPKKSKRGKPTTQTKTASVDPKHYPKPMTDFDNMHVTLRHDAVPQQPTVDIPQPQVKTKLPVVFNTEFGKMRMIVQAVLENSTGFALVFNDEDEVRFVPQQGSSLSISLPSGETVNAMYTGCLFAWPEDARQLMFFIKDNDQSNE